jgi:hypothetical protein
MPEMNPDEWPEPENRDVCDLCQMPVIQNTDGKWVHAEAADAMFCDLVMRRVY